MPIKTTELLCDSRSWDGAELPLYPFEKPELKVCRITFSPGAKTGWHHHNVINYGIVQRGKLTIVCKDGNERTFTQGEAFVEVVGTIHRGENRTRQTVILDMFYVASEGAEITTQHPEIISSHDSKAPAIHPQPKDREEARVFKLILALGQQKLPRRQLVAEMNMRQKSRHTFTNNYLRPAYERGYIDFVFPNSPNKPAQSYCLTPKGLQLYHSLTS